MFRRREIENAGLYSSDDRYQYAEDYELWVRVAARHQVANLADALYDYRLSPPRPAMERRQAASAAAIRELAAALFHARHEADVPAAGAAADGRILVLIATYRDPDCQWTIHDLFTRARHPDRITVGVCWQYEPRLDRDCFRIRTRPDQVKGVHVHVSDVRGLGWARHLTERLWTGEEYVLQIDGHTRFADGWDDMLLEQLAACRSRYPILSVYPWGFDPPRTLQEGPPTRMAALRFYDTGLALFMATPSETPPRAPLRHAFWAGGFAFSRAEVLREVPQDPHMYFNDTEPTHSVRLFTHGWDLFAPTVNALWHCYGPSKPVAYTPWGDNGNAGPLITRSRIRARHLLGLEAAAQPEPLEELPRYGLGTHRTVADYQRFAGLDFATQLLEDRALKGLCAEEYARPRF